MGAEVLGLVHGTEGGYTNHKCRCGPCTQAHSIAMQIWVSKNKPLPEGMDPDSYEAYKYYGSRTPGARAANAERRREQRRRKKEEARG
jgi:hypothetical protein